tara:strand:- start:282 stop:443 length:162 start_codon:yes stop_codon:yes gene_type:complete
MEGVIVGISSKTNTKVPDRPHSNRTPTEFLVLKFGQSVEYLNGKKRKTKEEKK